MTTRATEQTSGVNVSVIVPAYNAAATIVGTLESLLAQTCACWEAIIVDDGSTDATGRIAQQFVKRDNRFQLVAQENAGESGARNTGVGRAHYDWLLFLDADDWISPAYLERMTSALASDQRLDAIHCRYARVAGDGTEVVEQYRPPAGDLFSILARRAAFPVHACLVRKALVREVGLFDTSLRTSPDWDLWQRVARTGANFGALDEVLAFYRMSPHGASLHARQLFTDGLRVLKQGQTVDARVPHPHPDHACGAAAERLETQEFYLLCWCAGLLIGSSRDPRPLLEMVGEDRFPQLGPDAVAQCVFDAAPLPTCQPPRGWEQLWPAVQHYVADFFVALEAQSGASDLARTAMRRLNRMIVNASPIWSVISEELRELTEASASWQRLAEERAVAVAGWQRLAEERAVAVADWQRLAEERAVAVADWQRLAEERALVVEEQKKIVENLERSNAVLRQETEVLRTEIVAAESAAAAQKMSHAQELARLHLSHAEEIARLRASPEWRVGDTLWNAAGLAQIGLPAARAIRRFQDRRTRKRLSSHSAAPRNGSARPRAVVAACWSFPIPSQTFVYQEMQALDWAGLDYRVFCCEANSKDGLPEAFEDLWLKRVVLKSDWHLNQRDLAHFLHTRPERVESLLARLSQATGRTRDSLLQESIVMMGFTFARHVELSRADYVHTYFFYDQSFMALMAAWLLQIPRGITAYADHMLNDYAFKCVPLHLELADIIVATSQRIKSELNELNGGRFDDKIIVKPNGIDTNRFPYVAAAARLALDREPELISVSRIEPKKGLIYLVEALGILKARGIAVRLNIVGGVDQHTPTSADYAQELTARIGELGLSDRVILHGTRQQSEFLPLLARSRVFVAPYVEVGSGDKDGIPTAVLEAMSTGLPVVATDAGSILEAARAGIEALAVPQRDPGRLADAIEQLLGDPSMYAAMSERARHRAVSEFDAHVTERGLHARILGCLARSSGIEAHGRG